MHQSIAWHVGHLPSECGIPAEHLLRSVPGHVTDWVHRVGNSTWEPMIPPPEAITLRREEIHADSPLSTFYNPVAFDLEEQGIVEDLIHIVTANQIEATQVSGQTEEVWVNCCRRDLWWDGKDDEPVALARSCETPLGFAILLNPRPNVIITPL
jgi:hypothetical protein